MVLYTNLLERQGLSRRTEKKTMTAVHILGCHLEAIGWEYMVWGTPTELGRATAGVSFAYKAKAKMLSWGTGASQKGGIKESRFTLDYTLARASQLGTMLGPDVDQMRHWIQSVSVLDEESQNTGQEMKLLCERVIERGISQVTLVTSPFHMPRAYKEMDIVMRGDVRFAHLRKGLVLYPSETSLPDTLPQNEVTILERAHRGDMPKPTEGLEPHMLARQMFGIMRDPQKFQRYLIEWRSLLSRYT
jgi:hypothetical protein